MKNHKKIHQTNEAWKKELTPEQYHVMREKGTEPAFTGKYYNSKEKGMYKCAACGNELFSSDAKFDSGTGWPSFYEPIDKENVEQAPDDSLDMERIEVMCNRCGAHLGHAFDDLPRHLRSKAGGPKPTGKRFCINSCALTLDTTKE